MTLYFNFLLIFFLYQLLKAIFAFCYLSFDYYIGSDSLPRYSSIFCSALIFAMISFLVSSVNHWAIDFAMPFLSQKAIKYPLASLTKAYKFSSPTGSHLLSLLSFNARAGKA